MVFVGRDEAAQGTTPRPQVGIPASWYVEEQVVLGASEGKGYGDTIPGAVMMSMGVIAVERQFGSGEQMSGERLKLETESQEAVAVVKVAVKECFEK